mmetsp:Transcript_5513/g.9043  ORF Transcript_5513/g.9043 Transcript_5513/m.9043 type:complete len:470 (+) Transcript_5513:3-1412(+)
MMFARIVLFIGVLVFDVIRALKTQTVWTVFGDIASKTGSSNLGQGFPDWDPPQFVMDSLRQSLTGLSHQYTRPAGHPQLVKLLAERYEQHLNQEVDPMKNVAVTVGASQALFLALTTLLAKGDEIIMFDPFFELYTKQISLTGAVPKFVTLGGEAATLENPWALDIAALRKAVTSKTRVLLLNSPHNPTGKVFTKAEMEAIAEIVRENPELTVVSDEVYKFTVYDPQESGDPTSTGHHHFSRLPGMWDRTVTISSAGKTFSVTGWQVGWMVGPEKFINPVQALLPCVQFCAATPIQEALCTAIRRAEQPYEGYATYYEWLRSQFSSKRQILEEGLRAAGMEPIRSNGGVFLMARLPDDAELMQQWQQEKQAAKMDATTAATAAAGSDAFIEPYDWRYCRKLAAEHRVIGIPASPFFSNPEEAPPLARFAFCKTDDTLIEAARRLKTKTPTVGQINTQQNPSISAGSLRN